MQKAKAVFILIRFPNLIFIFLTQVLAWYFIIYPYLVANNLTSVLSNGYLYLLAFSTTLIAAAGYMINDYFDIGIDAINKPERVTIEKIFKRRTIITWHILLNVFALMMAGYIAFHFVLLRYLGFQLLSIFLLTVYSTTFKRKLIAGNAMISVLTSLSLLSVGAYEPAFPLSDLTQHVVKLFWIYVTFAFLITFSREVVKDIEDIKGDGLQHCQTIPLVWGIQTAKNVVFGLIILLEILLVYVCFNEFEIMFRIIYLTATVILPLLFVLYKVYKASNAVHFHAVSSLLKWITFAGILSMLCNDQFFTIN